MNSVDIWQTLAVMISLTALILGFIATRKKNLYPSNSNIDGVAVLLAKIDDLESRISERDTRIKELRNDIDAFKRERDAAFIVQRQVVASLQERIAFLETLLYNVTKNSGEVSTAMEAEIYVTPKTLLITSDSLIQRSDEIALNKARISYRRITEATLEKIDNEFRRRRAENKMYKYLIFSAHMNETGIELADGTILDSYWLGTNLGSDVKLIILNGCSSTKIADDLVGIANYVISMTENIGNNDAATFLTMFWRRFKHGDTLLTAYMAAKQSVPNAASFIDIQYNETTPHMMNEIEG